MNCQVSVKVMVARGDKTGTLCNVLLFRISRCFLENLCCTMTSASLDIRYYDRKCHELPFDDYRLGFIQYMVIFVTFSF